MTPMKICETCEGTGTLEQLNCNNMSNECCGGCYNEVDCYDCLGTGEVELTYDELIEFFENEDE